MATKGITVKGYRLDESSIYIAYDRAYIRDGDWWWYIGVETVVKRNGSVKDEIKYFHTEEQAVKWLESSDWVSTESKIYVLELPRVASTMILLDNDPTIALRKLLTIPYLEKLWKQQYNTE